MNEDQELEQINRYLRGELNAEEQKAFEIKMAQDTSFAREVALHEGIIKAVADEKTQDLEQQLKQVQEEWEKDNPEETVKEEQKTSSQSFFPYRMAAAIALLCTVGAILYFTTQSSVDTSADLFNKYYQPAIGEIARGTETATEDVLEKAFVQYHDQNYTKSIEYFEQVLKLKPGYIKAIFYLGHCYLNTEKIEKAVDQFKIVIYHGDNVYIGDAQWYLALAYLKMDSPDNAAQYLNSRSIGSSRAEKAQELLKAIQKLK